MPNYSETAREEIYDIGGAYPVTLLEIDHPDLSNPVRVVNDNQDIVSNGNTFTACAFDTTLPDDLSQGQPTAQLIVDNVGELLTSWVESSGGGEGATVRLMQVMRSDPDTLEMDITMDLSNVSMNASQVTGTLRFSDLLNQPGIPIRYRPEVAPGLF